MKKRVIAAALAVALVFTGCGINKKVDSANDASSVANSGKVEQTSDKTGTSEQDKASEGASDASSEASSVAEQTAKRGEPIVDADGHYMFNPYVGKGLLKDLHTQEEWDAFYNLIEALREGKDTYECANVDAFNFSINAAVWNEYFPEGYPIGSYGDGAEYSFNNGVVHITYPISKEEYLQKVKAFEDDIAGILKETGIRSDYSDFEKVLILYDYMATNFKYGYDMAENNPDMSMEEINDKYGTYNCFRNRVGICSSLAPAYIYLLHQVGVDNATQIDGPGHNWVYIELDGESYFTDPTWGLREANDGNLILDYFLMSYDKRAKDYTEYGVFIFDTEDVIFTDYKMPYTVTGHKYDFLDGAKFVSLDPDKNILTYIDASGKTQEYKY